MDAALQDLWKAVVDVPFNPALGIVAYWKTHWKELGSPVGPEHPGGDGNTYQAFARGIVRWTPGGPQVL